jgi:hypothetical protein
MGMLHLSVFRSVLKKVFLISVLAAFWAMPPQSSAQRPKNPEGWPKWQGSEGWLKWPDQDWMESNLKDAGKKLEIVKGISRPGPDIEFLQSKASDLLKQSSQARNRFFKCERLLNATNALLDAAYGIFASRKADSTPQDFWGCSRILQSLHSRIQQADFFASMKAEKNSEQYLTLTRSLYQQAQSAYDAREYQKAKYLADASWSIVTALESIAQAAIPTPATEGIPK